MIVDWNFSPKLIENPYCDEAASLLRELVREVLLDGEVEEAGEDGIDDLFAKDGIEWDSVECDGFVEGTRFIFAFPRGGEDGWGYLFELVYC